MSFSTPSDERVVNLDHLGLIAAVAKDLGLVGKIDEKLPRFDLRRVVSNGNAVLAMILNGLGFSNRRLILVSQFLANKPVDLLIDPSLKAEYFDDHVLGRALDEIADYGASKLFSEVAFQVALEQKLMGKEAHIDTSTFSVEGNYATSDGEGEIHVCHGFSKDHRPDLKQVVLNLAVTGPARMPIMMEPRDGNSSDKQVLHDGIEIVRKFQLGISQGFKEFVWIADAALYSKDRLLGSNDFFWVSRVPETIKEAKVLVTTPDVAITWKEACDGYKYSTSLSRYGGIEQRWIMIFSEQAYAREKLTFDEKVIKHEALAEKDLWHLGNQVFGCEKDAAKALAVIMKKYPFHEVQDVIITGIEKYQGKGRPKADAVKIAAGFALKATLLRSSQKIAEILATKGRFILATNQLEAITEIDILRSYKSQQGVEQGFRFLKDPWFMADTLFLKSPKRIEALMMIMTLCLMVYNVAEYRLRKSLKEAEETLPNQIGKQITKPTLRWIFQMMEGIPVMINGDENKIFNLTAVRRQIISYFGERACRIYGT